MNSTREAFSKIGKPRYKCMALGIDVSRANTSLRTGVEWYAFNIVRALISNLRFLPTSLYAPTPPIDGWAELPDSWQWRVLPGRRLWTQCVLPRHLRQYPVNCLFIPSSRIPPLRTKTPIVTTIHDIAFDTHPSAYPWHKRRWHRWVVEQAIDRASAIIVPTNSVKQDLIQRYPTANPDTVSVIPHGPSDDVPAIEEPRSPASFLYVGRIEKKKNIPALIQSIERIAHQAEVPEIVLTLVGIPGYGFDRIRPLLRKCPRHIRWIGGIDQNRLRALRRRTKFAVLPSLAEGFGLPVLDAWTSGCIPIISDCPALKEIAGDAAIVLPLSNPRGWDDIILKALKLNTTALLDNGKRQLRQFQWSTASRQTAEILQRFL